MTNTMMCSEITSTVGITHSEAVDNSWSYMLGEQNPYPAPTAPEMTRAPDGYEFVAMCFFARHGSRYALDREHIPDLLERFQRIAAKGRLTEGGQNFLENVERFSKWWGENTDRPGKLTDLGFAELQGMGKRAVQAIGLQEHNTKMGNHLTIVAKSSGAIRTLESESAYLYGAGKEAAKTRHPLNIITDSSVASRSVTDPHDYFGFHTKFRPVGRPVRMELLAKNDASAPEAIEDFVQTLVSGLSKEESIEMVNVLFELCQQDTPQGGVQGMCAPFAKWADNGGDKALFDWFFTRNQIDKFYMFGPAELYDGATAAMGNPMINEFVTFTDKAVKNPETTPALNVMFGHDAGLIGFMSGLGLMRGYGSDEERIAGFKPAEQFPMGSNIAWQLYRKGDDFRVRMLHNERPVSFPIEGCEDSELCSWETVKSYYTQPRFLLSALDKDKNNEMHVERFRD